MDSDDIDALLAVAESQGLAYDFGESDEDEAGVTGTGAAASGDGKRDNGNGNSPTEAAPATGPASQAVGSEGISDDGQPPTQCTTHHPYDHASNLLASHSAFYNFRTSVLLCMRTWTRPALAAFDDMLTVTVTVTVPRLTTALLSQRISNLKKDAAESARTAVKEREARPVQTPVNKRSLARERVHLGMFDDPLTVHVTVRLVDR